jgi:short-subunit dehydrogenase
VIPKGLAVVTGASAGIGREFCLQLASRGHDLLVVARDAARLQALAMELEARHRVRVEPFPADLSREEAIVRLSERLAAAGDLALLVNNAGFGTRGTLAEADPERQAEMVRLHAMAPMRLTRAALPAMLRRRAGAIVNVSSVASFIYSAGNANYCATKAYLTTFSEGVAAELRGTGVLLQALCPGFTITEFHQRMQVTRGAAPRFMWLRAEAVVRDSLRALDRGKSGIRIPGLGYRVVVGLIRVTPRRLLGAVTAFRRSVRSVT